MWDDSRVDTVEWRPVGEAGRGAPLGGAGDLSAILPSGRVLWFRVEAAPATAAALDRLAWDARSKAERRRTSLRRQALAIRLLRETTVIVAGSLAEERLSRARAIDRRIVKIHRRLDRRITRAAEKGRKRLGRTLEIERETARRLQRRDAWDKAVLATSLPLFAAFGEKGRPFGSRNLTLTLSSLIWLVGDDVVDAIFGPEEKSRYPVRNTDAWSYIAPFGNLLGGWWLLGDFQSERFVTGRTPMPLDPVMVTASGSDLSYRYLLTLDLSRVIGRSHLPAFGAFKDVPVVATVASFVLADDGVSANARITGVTAQVVGTDLEIRVSATGLDLSTATNPIPAFFRSLDVAWMVDTQEPVASS